MIAKLIAHGDTRQSALARMRTALEEIVIDGIETNIPLHQELCEDAAFAGGGTLSTTWRKSSVSSTHISPGHQKWNLSCCKRKALAIYPM